MGLLRDYLSDQRRKKAQEEEAQQLLARQLLSSMMIQPDVPSGGQIVQGPEGLMTTPGNTPLRFKVGTGKANPNELVQVDPDMARITGLEPGKMVYRWQLEKLYAPSERAKTLAEGQGNRQGAGFEHQEKLQEKAFTQQDELSKLKLENDFRKNALKTINNPESEDEDKTRMMEAIKILDETGEIPTFTEEERKRWGWLPLNILPEKVIVPKPKGGAKPATVPKPKNAAETQTRKKNPNTGKWWVFKGGKWQEE